MPNSTLSFPTSRFPNHNKVTYHLLLLPKTHFLLLLVTLNFPLLLHLTLNNHSHHHKMTSNPHHHQTMTTNPNLHLTMTSKPTTHHNTLLANPLATPHLHLPHLFSIALAPLLALHFTSLTTLPLTPTLPIQVLDPDPTP